MRSLLGFKTIGKCGGGVASVLLLSMWAFSLRWRAAYCGGHLAAALNPHSVSIAICTSAGGFSHTSWGISSVHRRPVALLWFGAGRLPDGVWIAVPLWAPLLASVLVAGAARRLEMLAACRRQGPKCPACGYDRAGLDQDSACPECGAAPPSARAAGSTS